MADDGLQRSRDAEQDESIGRGIDHHNPEDVNSAQVAFNAASFAEMRQDLMKFQPAPSKRRRKRDPRPLH